MYFQKIEVFLDFFIFRFLFFRKFGSSKRFGEGDKKDILDLLAVKIQLNNEEWQKKIQETEDELKRVKAVMKERETTAREISRNVQDFTLNHEKKLVTHSHGLVTTSDVVTGMSNDDNNNNRTLVALKDVITRLLFRINQIMTQREALQTERLRCFDVMKMKDQSQRTDDAISDVIATYRSQIQKMKRELKAFANGNDVNTKPEADDDVLDLLADRDDVIRELRKQVAEYEEATSSTSAQIVGLRQELDDTRTEMVSLRRNSRQQCAQLEALRHQLQQHSREPTVHFDERANTTVSIVQLPTLPSLAKRKAQRFGREKPNSASSTTTMTSSLTKSRCGSAKTGSATRKLRRPSTVH